MRHIFLNLKRFDIPREMGGVNDLAPVNKWAETIVKSLEHGLWKYENADIEFSIYFPEAHLISAVNAKAGNSVISIGCQGIYGEDTEIGGNFGAFTTSLTANAAKNIGCESVLIGHSEERKKYADIIPSTYTDENKYVNSLLNKSIKRAVKSGLRVLYCIGEKKDEKDQWKDVLRTQLEIGLQGIDTSRVCIAYEPIWAIGPGETPPDGGYIAKIIKYVKKITGGLDVVYGGGLKEENARMVSSVDGINGGLIALTRFSGEIGFYPDEYLKIVELYFSLD